MYKKILLIIFFFLLSNCTAPGTALLGPIFTGAKTGSIYQASLSYGSSKIIRELNNFEILESINSYSDEHNLNLKNKDLYTIPYTTKHPIIIVSHKVDIIDVADISEIEHLP